MPTFEDRTFVGGVEFTKHSFVNCYFFGGRYDLRNCIFHNCTFGGIFEVDFYDCSFHNCVATEAKFNGNFRRATIFRGEWAGCVFTGSSFCGSEWIEADLVGADFHGADLGGEHDKAIFQDCLFRGANISTAEGMAVFKIGNMRFG